MARRRIEPLSQRLLAVDLRTAIDRARRRPHDTNARERALRLAREHPHGIDSAHVRRNVGAARLAWLARTRESASSGRASLTSSEGP